MLAQLMNSFRRRLRSSGFLILLLGLTGEVAGVVPENGIYWAPGGAGTGFVLERQNGLVAFQIYTQHALTGEPIFYIGAGELRDDVNGLPDQSPPALLEGYFPLHWVRADLTSVSRDDAGNLVYTPFGRADLYFPAMAQVHGYFFDASGAVVRTLPPRFVRFNFGYEWIGAHPYGPHTSSSLVDLSGEWVFVDRTEALAAPLRFRFQRTAYSPVPGEEFIFSATYEDSSRNAFLTCRFNQRFLGFPDERSGCELAVGNQVVLSFNQGDYGIDEIEAFAGELPPRLEEPLRGEHRYTGMRVQHVPGQSAGVNQ